MISLRHLIGVLLAACLSMAALGADPGKESIGTVKVVVYHATNGDPEAAGDKSQAVSAETAKQLAAQKSLRFENYRLLGSDSKPVFRSYENWAQPIQGSDEVLCRFEVESRVSDSALRLDLELWLSRKKILKSGVVVAVGKPVLVLGPEWRGGRLITSVELAPQADKSQ